MALIARYRLNGDAKDHVGENHGTIVGSPVTVNGKLENCLDFNGSSDYIFAPEVSNYLDFRPEASLSLWIKKNSIQYGFLQLSGYANSNGNLYPYQTETTVYLDIFRTDRLGPIYMNSSVLEWHHVVITQKPGEWKLYQNGELIHTAGANNFVRTNYLQFEIGRNSGGRYADALINDVRIYDHALSLKEIKEISKAKVLHYTFNTNEENTIVDSSGFDNNGVNSGASFSLDNRIGSGAYEFTHGNNTKILTENFNALNNIDGIDNPITISFGGNGKNNIGSYDGFFNIENTSGYNGLTCNITTPTAKRIRFWQDGGTTLGWSSPNTINNWNHIVIVLNSNIVKVFENGIQVVSNSFFTNPFAFSNVIHWGIYLYADSWLDGYIDDVRIYATALSADDIKSLYESRASVDKEGNFFINTLSESFSYISPLSCSQVSFAGNGYNDTCGESDPCSGLLTFEQALQYAYDRGGRLPTRDELYNNATAGSGCGYDSELCWTCDKGADSSEHWVMAGKPTSYPDIQEEIRKNTETAYVRFVSDINLDRTNPVTLNDKAVRGLAMGVTKQGVYEGLNISELGPADGLVAYYPLDGHTKDYSGNGNHGTNYGAIVATGIKNTSYEFNGLNDYIKVNNQIVSSPTGLTISGWIYPVTGGSNYRCALHHGADSSVGSSRYWLGISAGHYLTATIGASSGVGWSAGETTTTVTYNTWTHLAATWDGTTVRTYINGVQEKQYALASYGSISSPTRIGASSDGANYQYAGKVDEVRIYNRALSAEEVGILYDIYNPDGPATKMTQDTLYIKGQFKENY